MCLFWGSEPVCFFNQAFLACEGDHAEPVAVGKDNEAWDRLGPIIDRVTTTGTPVSSEEQQLFFTGGKEDHARHRAFHFHPAYNDEGRIGGVLLTCVETTGTTVTLKNPEPVGQELKDIILQAPMGICIIDAATLVSELVNESFIKVAGKPKEAIIGKMYWDTFAEVRTVYETALQKAIDEGTAFYANEVELVLIRHGKEEKVFVTFVYLPIKNAAGAVKKLAIYVLEDTMHVLSRQKVEDLVEQRTRELAKAHEDVLQSYNYLQFIINEFKTPMQVLEPVFENGGIVDFRYKLTNAAYAAYANTTPEKLHHKKVGEVFPGYFQTSSFINVAKTFMTGNPDTWEIHYNQDGLDLYNEMSATKMEGEVVLQFTDFTKLKHLELELLGKIEELERSNQQLEEFAHAASHDLKEPIRKILIFTAQLKDQLSHRLKEGEIRTFERIQNATQRMGLLVDDLLLFSHVSQKPHEKEPVDLNELMKQVLDVLDLEIEQKTASIQIGSLPTVQGYCRQLQQLFQNLVSNALKYSKAEIPPCIHIISGTAAENGQSYSVIEVQDNGIGFEQQYARKIFQMFSRLHGRSEYSGTGVGLSIAKKVVENHDGQIHVESEPDVGSTFKIYLPEFI
jgi:signal transduction histidine kinase